MRDDGSEEEHERAERLANRDAQTQRWTGTEFIYEDSCGCTHTLEMQPLTRCAQHTPPEGT